jgi:hypothetical protein
MGGSRVGRQREEGEWVIHKEEELTQGENTIFLPDFSEGVLPLLSHRYPL